MVSSGHAQKTRRSRHGRQRRDRPRADRAAQRPGRRRHPRARHQGGRRAPRPRCAHAIVGDILDQNLLGRLVSEFEITTIFHLAALLSTRAEFTPETAHHVNVDGCLNLLKLAVEQSRWHGQRGEVPLPEHDRGLRPPRPRDQEEAPARPRGPVHRSRSRCTAATSSTARTSAATSRATTASSRSRPRRPASTSASIRFPGLISAFTLPSGGTSDYAPEMIHAAAQAPALRVLRPRGGADAVHGDARRHRRDHAS